MRILRLTAILALSMVLACASTAAAGTIYFSSDVAGVTTLYTLATDGAATPVGVIKSGASDLAITDIAYDFKTSTMYAITTDQLYSLDYSHPVSSVVTANLLGATTGATLLQGLAVSSDGTIYAGSNPASKAGNLYTLSSSTGAATLVGSFGTGGTATNYLRCYGDLAFSPTGDLYGMFRWTNVTTGNNYLGSVASGGAVTPIGSGTTDTGADGLIFVGDTLYMVRHAGFLDTLNLSTGDVSTNSRIKVAGVNIPAGDEYGLTYVPLPPTLLLLGSGLLGLGLLRRKRRLNK